MINWNGMMLLVSVWSLKSPLHSTAFEYVLCELFGTLFRKSGFFMDCIRILLKLSEITPYMLEFGKRVLRTSEIGIKILRLSICKKKNRQVY